MRYRRWRSARLRGARSALRARSRGRRASSACPASSSSLLSVALMPAPIAIVPVDDRDHPVGTCCELGVVGDQQHRAAAPKPFDRLTHDPCALRIEVRRRLVENDERCVAKERAGKGDALALSGREQPGSLSDEGGVAVRAGRSMSASAPASARRLAHALVRGGRVAEADVVGDRATKEGRALRHPGDLPTPRAASQSARSMSPRRIRPAEGSWKRRSKDARVLLPPPLGPTSATVSPGGDLERDVDERRRRPVGIRERDGLEPDRRLADRLGGTVEPDATSTGCSISSSSLSATAAPSALAWNPAARLRSGRYSSGASTSTVSAGSKAMPPSTSRTPTVTATSATPSVAASSSTVPERNARRSVPIVAVRYSSLTCSIRSACASPRLKPAGSAARGRRRGNGSRAATSPASARARGAPVARPISQKNTGHERQRQQHQPGGDEIERRDEAREPRSAPRRRGRAAGDTGRTVAASASTPCHGGRRHLCALGSVERGRAALQPRRHEIEAQLRDHTRRGPGADRLEARRRRERERRRRRREGRAARRRLRASAPAKDLAATRASNTA